MEDHLRDHPAVREMRGNPRAGSLVVQYDAGHTAQEDMEKAVLERAWHYVEAAEPSGEATRATGGKAAPQRRGNLPRRRGPRPLRMRINRVAKVAMLVSLGVSLAVAELRPRGWKHWHAMTGWAFVVALSATGQSLLRAKRRAPTSNPVFTSTSMGAKG
ncbi:MULTISPECIES: hypothetical protein [unclassified Ectothiorhodospira]|uniref:hypothetical protein n=1 Tax=unclassified Ectothiorhodospira TaxID=2684909 RepID=UPI001EE930CE|nr:MULTISPECIES: hypothetical protein [unclassified Ectothiorhodospira]MCG5514943.1 hypothetical protein [Ectothiorhodospira sp. 9100]MCG5517732.1 hypothetical protein [Ectothiorhodospira sp. 9905]